MDNALTPREIQTRIRSGASVADVAEAAGMDIDRVTAFAGPVLAEREHIATSAQTATVRRRGESGGHRRLGELISQRLASRGLDAEEVLWDAWRQPDLKWRVVGAFATDTAEARLAEFVFDAKARFSVAANEDARWMIGEEAPGAAKEDEITVDFKDEFALVRAVSSADTQPPGDDVPASDLMHDAHEDTSQLDRLYDMLSGISEDSVRIYTDFSSTVEPEVEDLEPESAEADQTESEPLDTPISEDLGTEEEIQDQAPPGDDEPTTKVDLGAEQETLVESPDGTKPPTAKPRRKRAKVPTWDEIMFGGPKS